MPAHGLLLFLVQSRSHPMHDDGFDQPAVVGGYRTARLIGMVARGRMDVSPRENVGARRRTMMAGMAVRLLVAMSLPGSARAQSDTEEGRGMLLSLHVACALIGTTALDVPGYASINGRQPHTACGVRVAGSPYGTWWAVEVNVSGEWPAVSTTHERKEDELDIFGPRLRADAGLRGRFGTVLMPTFYAGMGLQAHYRDITETNMGDMNERSSVMPFEGVLALGTGLEFRAGNLSLGIELHVRQGVAGDYRSVAAVLSLGAFLDRGE